MCSVEFKLDNDQQQVTVGDVISGSVQVTLSQDVPLSNVELSFHCLGEVKWIEVVDALHFLKSDTFYDHCNYYDQVYRFSESDLNCETKDGTTITSIRFKFEIPKDKNLPSSMISGDAFVKYYLAVAIKSDSSEVVTKFYKPLIVQAPFEKNLMISVGSTVQKCVLLHVGPVELNASISRKGFAPGENISVHVRVDNKTTNASVIPRVNLNQVQIYQCGIRVKVLENQLSREPIIGSAVEPQTEAEQLLSIEIPSNESLSIKSDLITVKYFVQVDLDIPHSLDLHLRLPIVVTSHSVINSFDNDFLPQMIEK